MTIHIVSSGESITSIAAMYQIPAWKIIYDNQIRLPDRLVPGQALLIMEEGTIEGEGSLTLVSEGYAYPFTRPEYLTESFSVLGNLLSFSAGFSMEGQLYPPEDESMRELAAAYGVPVTLTLTPSDGQGIFSNYLVHQASAFEAVQDRLVEELLIQMRGKGYRGVNVDFEYVQKADGEGYLKFVEKLKESLEKEGYLLSVALAPKTSDSQTGLLYEGIDYRRLGEIADSVVLMTYEWGYTYSIPMAVAPLNKVNEVVEYAVSRIVPEKIYMGIPNYAYDWALPYEKGLTRATTIGNVDAVQIAALHGTVIQYDETAQTPWFRYTQNGVDHEVWFEDVRSIHAKLLLADSYDLKGVTYWNLLRPFRANWLLLEGMKKWTEKEG